MAEWKDYYKILLLDPNATEEEIKRAFRKKCTVVHPDKVYQTPTARHYAEEEFKNVKEAYDVLIDPVKRRKYDAEWWQKKNTPSRSQESKPNPVATPPFIRFSDVAVGEIQTASFIVQNKGGPYANSAVISPDSWLHVTNTRLLDPSGLPLQIEIEAVGEKWGEHYVDYIVVRLDDQEARVKVELSTRAKPRGKDYSSSRTATGPIPHAKTKGIEPCRNMVAGIFGFIVFILNIITIIELFVKGDIGGGLSMVFLGMPIAVPIEVIIAAGVGWLIGFAIDKIRGL